MKTLARITLYILSGIFALISLLVLLSLKQVNKNRLVFADMKERVVAVKEFEKKNGHLPSQEEFTELSRILPVFYYLYDYRIDTSPSSFVSDNPKDRPPSGGWVISFWRSEWAEYYSSWNDYYSIADSATLWGFCGPLLFAPVLAAGFFAAARHKFFAGRIRN